MNLVSDDATAMEEEAGRREHVAGEQSHRELVLLSLSLACGGPPPTMPRGQRRRRTAAAFECRTCGRRFASFQALGGHRSSHLRRRSEPRPVVRREVHECGVCGLGFSMGQALGGHMRRHRVRKNERGGSLGLKQMAVQESFRPTSNLQLLELFL